MRSRDSRVNNYAENCDLAEMIFFQVMLPLMPSDIKKDNVRAWRCALIMDDHNAVQRAERQCRLQPYRDGTYRGGKDVHSYREKLFGPFIKYSANRLCQLA